MDRTADIARLILAHAEDMEIGSPPLPIFFHNQTVKLPNKTRYALVEVMPNATTAPGVGFTDSLVQQGLLYIRVFGQIAVGSLPALTEAQAVVRHFPRSLRLYADGLRVEIQAGTVGGVIFDPPQQSVRVFVPVTIPWRAVASALAPA